MAKRSKREKYDDVADDEYAVSNSELDIVVQDENAATESQEEAEQAELGGADGTFYAEICYSQSFWLKCLAFFMYYFIGCLYYSKAEGWSVLWCIYFLTVTCTTVGYGYFHPSTEESRAVTLIFILVGASGVMYIINEFSKQFLMGAHEQLVLWIVQGLWQSDETSQHNLRIYRVYLSIFLIFLSGLIGSVFYYANEGWSYLDAVYWTVCTMSTVGYGDLEVKYDSTRAFAIFFIYFCVCIYAVFVGNVFDQWAAEIRERVEPRLTKDFVASRYSSRWQSSMAAKCGGRGMSRERFILEVLQERGRLSWKEDISPILTAFHAAVKHSDGHMGGAEIEVFVRSERARAGLEPQVAAKREDASRNEDDRL